MSALTRPVSILPRGTAFARYVQVKALSDGDYYTGMTRAEHFRDTPHVAEALRLQIKSAIPAGDTIDGVWAGPLAAAGIASEAITIERGMSIRGALEQKMQTVPLNVKVPVETGTGVTGGWITQGGPTPVQSTAFAAVLEAFYKFGVIAPLTEELIRISSPSAEATINRIVIGGLSASIDNNFLLPTVTAVANTNPASITNGATERVSTGSTAAAIAADLASMLGSITTSGAGLTWIMKPKTMYYLALTLGSQAAGLPNTLFGIPVIASISSPAQITLADAGDDSLQRFRTIRDRHEPTREL